MLSWQVDLARDLGCERFVCLSDAKSEAFDDLRDYIEEFGGEFHSINGHMPLVGLLSADQEIVVLADGLIADRSVVSTILGDRRGVLCLPDTQGIEAGFERIDAQHAWAGLFVARAQIVESLAEMPPDSDTVSLLLRLALQAGTKLQPIDDDMLNTGQWLLVKEGTEIAMREANLLDASVERVSWWQPTKAVTRRLARIVAPDGFERGPIIANIAGLGGVLGAIGAALSGQPILSLGLVAISVFSWSFRDGLMRLAARLRGDKPPSEDYWRSLAIDLLIVLLLSWPFDVATAPERIFLPIMLLGLLRLGAIIWPQPYANFLEDRFILVIALMLAGSLGVQSTVTGAICFAIVALSLIFKRESQITRA